jgi:hypothetical protein
MDYYRGYEVHYSLLALYLGLYWSDGHAGKTLYPMFAGNWFKLAHLHLLVQPVLYN